MDWYEATRFCRWLNARKLVPKGWLACLPTEAEWEYACRAGTETEYYTGDGEEALEEAGWFDGNSTGATHSVGQKAPNGFGLYDLHGNVWEWCHDAYEEDRLCTLVDGVRDPGAAERDASYLAKSEPERKDFQSRVLRGGSWIYSAGYCRSAARFGFWAVFRYRTIGFRVCLVPGPLAIERGAL
jgi:formylglycine-generating enzyme required for sulfatase activity